MDKTWIHHKRTIDSEYRQGCTSFLNFAFANNNGGSRIYCPCKKCLNIFLWERDLVEEHIVINGFNTNYIKWTYHGETHDLDEVNPSICEDVVDMIRDTTGDDMEGLIRDGLNLPRQGNEFNSSGYDRTNSGPDEETMKFFKLLVDADRELYDGCEKFTLLSFIVRLLHTKSLFGWSDKSFDVLLGLLNEAFPQCRLPASTYEAKKFREALSFNYKKYDACPNDCMLYWKDNALKEKCDFCGECRYKQFKGDSDQDNTKSKKIAVKQVRHFPLKPRLQRLFMSKETASLMRWHDEERLNDGRLRHPADSPAWKIFDEKHPDFAIDRRNVRLGLASDGFNPFRTMSISHSTWPVILVPYNLPPWLCMKQSYMMLSLLIDGPKGPGNDIDVYLEPLIEELKELWIEGMDTFDAAGNHMFRMRVALLWTINDFPAYANLSGWSTKGKLACPVCNKDTDYRWLSHWHKLCYMGSRRALDDGHKFRRQKNSFDGTVETRKMPTRLSGEDVLRQVEDIENQFGKRDGQIAGKKRKNPVISTSGRPVYNWKKKSIFFELPYWKDNLIRHNLDVMHIEKNVCESLLHTILGFDSKSKDGIKARYDLKEMGIREQLHPVPMPSGKSRVPHASYTLTKQSKSIFLRMLKNVKVPDGYAGNISRSVNLENGTIYGLKSHDYHILMQQLLPIAVRRLLPKDVAFAIVELGNFFRQLCSKVIDPTEFTLLQERIRLTLCHLEKIFPPSFFDIMVHLLVHLPEEAKIAGPVLERWMYSPERYMYTLKQYVRNRSRPEGSIAEGYLAEECTTFCSRYLNDVESKLNRPKRNDHTDEDGIGKGKRDPFVIDNIQWEQAHRFVLANCPEVAPFREQHSREIEFASRKNRKGKRQRTIQHNQSFSNWFRDHVQQMRQIDNSAVSEELESLSCGPSKWVKRYKEYRINGLKFRTKESESTLTTQNSGVMLKASTNSFASASDDRPVVGDVIYYGVLTDIIEFSYSDKLKHVMFKCDWVDNAVGLKEDEFKYTMVNFNHLMYKQNLISHEPFILASQAQQVWYIKDPVELDWHVVVKSTPRDFYNMHSYDGDVEDQYEDDITYAQDDLPDFLLMEDVAQVGDENEMIVHHLDDDIEVQDDGPHVLPCPIDDDDFNDDYDDDDGAGIHGNEGLDKEYVYDEEDDDDVACS